MTDNFIHKMIFRILQYQLSAMELLTTLIRLRSWLVEHLAVPLVLSRGSFSVIAWDVSYLVKSHQHPLPPVLPQRRESVCYQQNLTSIVSSDAVACCGLLVKPEKKTCDLRIS